MDYVYSSSKVPVSLPTMRLEKVLTQEEFDGLLSLFSDDREAAGLIYEELRTSLVRYFETRDCRDADMLAD